MNEYRWIVRVESWLRRDYAREVLTDGPTPEKAIIKALTSIAREDDQDLWQQDKLTVTAERVR